MVKLMGYSKGLIALGKVYECIYGVLLRIKITHPNLLTFYSRA